MAKQPKILGRQPTTTKTPRIQTQVLREDKPVWAFGQIDFNGPFCPKCLDKDSLLEVVDRLRNFELSTWPDIERGGSHSIEVWKLQKVARDRLTEIQLDDIDRLYSMRVTGRGRVWGVKFNNTISLLWWDPEHRVYPVEKRHT